MSTRGRRCRPRLRLLIRWPWYFEADQVSSSEYLLRAIPNTAHYFDRAMGPWVVGMAAFLPDEKRDHDGMSFFREDFCTPRQAATLTGRPLPGFVCARCSIWRLRGLYRLCQPQTRRSCRAM